MTKTLKETEGYLESASPDMAWHSHLFRSNYHRRSTYSSDIKRYNFWLTIANGRTLGWYLVVTPSYGQISLGCDRSGGFSGTLNRETTITAYTSFQNKISFVAYVEKIFK
ncbi:hypothetical protein J6590_013905 [Homalodisca vitripennis]|nr:hypothetical protein J6590_013905 [Homalodisca vitripennis]